MNYQYNPYAAPQAAPPLPPGDNAVGAPQPWSVGEMISIGWERFKQNWAILVFSYFIVMVILQVVSKVTVTAVGTSTDIQSSTYWTALGASTGAQQLVTAYFQPGLIRIWLGVARGQSPSFGLLFTGFDRFLPFLALTFISSLLIGLGFVLLIVPGVIISLGLFLSQYYLVDANMGPIAAMKASWENTKGQKGDIFLLALAGVGLFLLGMVMCLIGLFATYPIFMVAAAAAYTRMSGVGAVASAYGDVSPPAPPPPGYGPPPGYRPPPGYGPPPG